MLVGGVIIILAGTWQVDRRRLVVAVPFFIIGVGLIAGGLYARIPTARNVALEAGNDA